MLLRLAQRSLQLRPQRFFVAVLSVAMGTAVAVAFADLSLVLGDRLAHSLRAYGANLILVPEGSSLDARVAGTDFKPALRTGAIAESVLVRIHDTFWRNNILGYAPRLAAVAHVRKNRDSAPLSATVVGTWFDRRQTTPQGFSFTAGMTTVAPWWEIEGRLPRASSGGGEECLVGKRLAARLDVAQGGRLYLEVFGSEESGSEMPSPKRPAHLLVTGILDAGGFEDETIYVQLDKLQALLDRPDQVDRVLISALIRPGFPQAPDPAEDPAAFEQWACTPYVTSVAYELDRALPGVEARPVSQLVQAEGRIVHRLNLLMLLLTLAALTGAALGVTSTMTASVVDRTREFALQRSLGASTGSLAALLSLEAVTIGLLGGTLGSAAGLILARVAGRATFGSEIPFHPLVLVLGLVVAVAVTAVGSWAPLRWAISVSPAQGLRA